MLVLPSPSPLLLGYLLGAMMTSVTLGLVIVFSLNGSSSATSIGGQTDSEVLFFLALTVGWTTTTRG